MVAMKKIAKCSNCCPDGGAIFKKEMSDDGWQWKCQNCHMVVMCRKHNPTPKVTPSQQKVIDRITKMGWVVRDQKFIGRKLFISFDHPTRDWLLGNSFFGVIGPAGGFEFDWHPVFGTTKKLTDVIDLDVYLR